jgi:hypothetical protein
MAKLIGTGTNQVPTNGMLGGMAFQTPEDVTVEKIQENNFNVVTQTDIGTAPNQIPLNQFLGGLAYMDSVAGLDFSTTSSATYGTVTSQILDDYEEGTWTPAWGSTSGQIGTITYVAQSGIYTKIGNRVYIECRLAHTSANIGTASGGLLVIGLPFMVASSAGSGGSPSFNNVNFADPTVNLATETRENSNQFYAGLSSRDGDGWVNLTVGGLNYNGSCEIRVQFMYKTN